MENFLYYIFCIIALIAAVFVFKKVASCLIKTILFVAILAVLIFVYFQYFS